MRCRLRWCIACLFRELIDSGPRAPGATPIFRVTVSVHPGPETPMSWTTDPHDTPHFESSEMARSARAALVLHTKNPHWTTALLL